MILLDILAVSTGQLMAQIGEDGPGLHSGRGKTFMAMYTVPAGKTGYVMQWTAGSGKQNTDATAHMYTRENGGNNSWRVVDILTTSATTYEKRYITPVRMGEKTDIEIRAFSSVPGSQISSTFHLFLIDNPVV